MACISPAYVVAFYAEAAKLETPMDKAASIKIERKDRDLKKAEEMKYYDDLDAKIRGTKKGFFGG
jgi:hypothetical protein